MTSDVIILKCEIVDINYYYYVCYLYMLFIRFLAMGKKRSLCLLVIRETEGGAARFLAEINGDREQSGHDEFRFVSARSKQAARHECHFSRHDHHTIQSKTSHHGERSRADHEANTTVGERDVRSQGR